MSDLFDDGHGPAPPRSTVGTLAGLGPTRTNALGNYPPPWYISWDAPVWRVLAQDRTVVATCSDEKAARMICNLVMLVRGIAE